MNGKSRRIGPAHVHPHGEGGRHVVRTKAGGVFGPHEIRLNLGRHGSVAFAPGAEQPERSLNERTVTIQRGFDLRHTAALAKHCGFGL